jgi:hypothetical protein
VRYGSGGRALRLQVGLSNLAAPLAGPRRRQSSSYLNRPVRGRWRRNARHAAIARILAIVARRGVNARPRHPSRACRTPSLGLCPPISRDRRWPPSPWLRLPLGFAGLFHQLGNIIATARPHGGHSIERVSTHKSKSMRVFFHDSVFADPSLLMTSHVA